MQGSTYESRAWTFQERMLSRRILYITDSGLNFQCRESFHLELNWPMLECGPNELFNAFAQLDSPETNPLMSETWYKGGQGTGKHSGIDAPIPLTEWTVYFDVVRIYSQRHLNYVTDALFAFAGIEAVLAAKYQTPFHYGLPRAGGVTQLHWIPADEPEYATFK